MSALQEQMAQSSGLWGTDCLPECNGNLLCRESAFDLVKQRTVWVNKHGAMSSRDTTPNPRHRRESVDLSCRFPSAKFATFLTVCPSLHQMWTLTQCWETVFVPLTFLVFGKIHLKSASCIGYLWLNFHDPKVKCDYRTTDKTFTRHALCTLSWFAIYGRLQLMLYFLPPKIV